MGDGIFLPFFTAERTGFTAGRAVLSSAAHKEVDTGRGAYNGPGETLSLPSEPPNCTERVYVRVCVRVCDQYNVRSNQLIAPPHGVHGSVTLNLPSELTVLY